MQVVRSISIWTCEQIPARRNMSDGHSRETDVNGTNGVLGASLSDALVITLQAASPERYQDTVKVVADCQVELLKYDADIVGDQIKYATWLVAPPTACIGLLVGSASVSKYAGAHPLVAAVLAALLLLGMVMAATVHWYGNKALEGIRLRISLFRSQQLYMFCVPQLGLAEIDIRHAMERREFCREDENTHQREESGTYRTHLRILLLIEQVAVSTSLFAITTLGLLSR